MKNKISENPGSFHFNVSTFFRSGKTEDWKTKLSSENIAAIDNKTAILWDDSLNKGLNEENICSLSQAI
jgi:hypothetical protein